MNIPLRLLDWRKIRKTGRGYTRRELTVVTLLKVLAAEKPIESLLNVGFHDYCDIGTRWWIDYPPNVEAFRQQAPPADRHRITLGSLLDIESFLPHRFDALLHWHGPEHLDRDEFLDILPAILSRAGRLAVFGCPNGGKTKGRPTSIRPRSTDLSGPAPISIGWAFPPIASPTRRRAISPPFKRLDL